MAHRRKNTLFVAHYGETTLEDDEDNVPRFLSIHRTFSGAVGATLDCSTCVEHVKEYKKEEDKIDEWQEAKKQFQTSQWSPTETNICHLLYAHTWDDSFHANEVELTEGNSMKVVMWDYGGGHKITGRIVFEVRRALVEQ